MEERDLATELQHSRAQLRALLLPDPETGRIEADAFPRSEVMRFLFTPGRRRLAMLGLALATKLARWR